MKILQVLIACSQLLNTVLLGGYADESTSSHSYRLEQKGSKVGKAFRIFIDFIFLPAGKEHCKKAWESEKLRHQFPKELRDKDVK